MNERYVVAIKMGDDSPIEYVKRFASTGLDTVRLKIEWTKNIEDALVWTVRDLFAPGSGYIDVRCGFSRCAIRRAP